MRSCKLSDISTVLQTGPFGSQLHQADYTEVGTPVIMPKDIIDGIVTTDGIAHIPQSFVNKLSRHKVSEGDILFSRRGEVSKTSIVLPHQAGWLCGTGCLRASIDKTVAFPRYVFYYLQQQSAKLWLVQNAIGSTMLNLNTTIIGNLPITLPTMDEQNRIAEILTRYDDAIENCQRQIALLEEAAQRTYLNFVNEVYSEYGEISDIAVFKRGKVITKKDVQDGNIPVVAGGLGPAYYHNESNTTAPVLTVSASGANAGFSRLYFENIWASDCSYIDASTKYIFFIYCFLKTNKRLVDNLQKGAAQPHVYPSDLNGLPIAIPATNDLEKFTSSVNPIFERIAVLEKQIVNLRKARELLLPRLISGEITI